MRVSIIKVATQKKKNVDFFSECLLNYTGEANEDQTG